MTNMIAAANRIAGGYPETPSQPAIVFSPPRQSERTRRTSPVASQSSA